MKMKLSSVAVMMLAQAHGSPVDPVQLDVCCKSCDIEGQVKYFIIDKIYDDCAECCMSPADYPIFKLFEKGLELANSTTICDDLGYHTYKKTEANGFGKLTMVFDMYSPSVTRR